MEKRITDYLKLKPYNPSLTVGCPHLYDGNKSDYTYVGPLLKRYGFGATIFHH